MTTIGIIITHNVFAMFSPQKHSGSEVLLPSHVSGEETDSGKLRGCRASGRVIVKPRTNWLQSLYSWLPHRDPGRGGGMGGSD